MGPSLIAEAWVSVLTKIMILIKSLSPAAQIFKNISASSANNYSVPTINKFRRNITQGQASFLVTFNCFSVANVEQ